MNPLNDFKNYLTFEKNYSENTINAYIRDILDFENFILKEEFAKSLLDVKRDRLGRHYISYLDTNGLTKKTIARKISSLRTFYNYLLKNNLIDKNIFQSINSPKLEKKLPNIIQNKELERIFQSLDTTTPLGYRNYLLLDILFSTGIRASELTNITLVDINLSNETILIHGKGKKDRYIPLHNGLIQQLRHYITFVRPVLLAKGSDTKNTHLFLSYKGDNLSVRGLQHILKTIIEKSGETYKIHPHMLRHAFATIMLDNGADLRTVQELLGHAHLKSTQVYTHISPKTLREKYNKAHPRMINKRKIEDKT